MSDPGDESNRQTVNEQRAERGLAPLPRGSIIGVGDTMPFSDPAESAPSIGTWTIRIDRGLLDRLMETGRLEIPNSAGNFIIELRDGPVQNLLNAELVEAVRALYYAAWWTPDRKCDAAALWEGVRDAARLTPGEAAKALGERPAVHDYRNEEHNDALRHLKNAAFAAKKRIEDLTDDELIAEWREWDDKVKDAKSWGGGLAAASEFRDECQRELNSRGLIAPETTP